MENKEQLSAVDVLLNRFSQGGKHLVAPGPERHQIRIIAEAALRAPDHGALIPFRLCIIQGDAKQRMANLFEKYAIRKGKDEQSCAIERDRALRVPVTIAVIARIDAHHPLVPSHEQWMCIGGAITNVLNAIHMMGFAGKMLSGDKVRSPEITGAFCDPGESLVGFITVGTPLKEGKAKSRKSADTILSFY